MSSILDTMKDGVSGIPLQLCYRNDIMYYWTLDLIEQGPLKAASFLACLFVCLIDGFSRKLLNQLF